MGQHNLDRIMKPQHVAVVGASEKAGTIGHALMCNLIEGGFPGTVLPVNQNYQGILGYPSYKSVLDLQLGVDLAIIATPIQTVPEIIRQSVSRVKPIIVLKAGRSMAGAKAAASHTGALAGEDAVYDAAFKRAGIVRVDTIEELFDCAELMAKQPRPRGPRLAIITNGGGPGVMAADFLSRHGHEPVPLDTQTITKLDAILPLCWSRNNPIDILGDALADRYRQVLDICIRSHNFDGILVILAPQAVTDPMSVAKSIVDTMKDYQYPVFASWMGGKSIVQAVEFLNESTIPTFDTPERAVRAFLHMVTFARNQELRDIDQEPG